MKQRRLIAVTLAGALALAACGDDDDESGSDTTDAATETTAESGADDTTADTTGDTATETTTGDTTATSDGAATPGEGWPSELVFTLTPSQETGGLIDTAEPLAAMLEERLGVPVEALVPSDYAGVIAALGSGQAHVAGGLGPAQMVQAEDQADATLILQAERFGGLTYVTQWFTNDPATYCTDEPVADEDGFLFCNGVLDAEGPADGPIGEDSLELLDGQTVAFVDQGSASGYQIPLLQLIKLGLEPDSVDALFAGGHDASVQAVYDGDAVAGVSFNDARGQLVEQVPDVGEKVVVFAWSQPIPNDGFAVAGDLPDDLKQAITDAFVDISQSEEGVALLQELYEIDALVPVNSSDYDVMRELQAELGDLLE